MKNEEKGKSKKETVKETVKSNVGKEHSYPIKQLLDNCEAITGHKKEVGIGALFGAKKDKLTKKEFKTKIVEFLQREVK